MPPRGFFGTQHAFGASDSCFCEYQSVVHSQTLPMMSCTPYPFGGNAGTGGGRSNPSSFRFCRGNSPCQVLAWCLPPGVNSSPQAYSAPSSPPRAANSHSASVGKSLPAQREYVSASANDTCTTG